MSHIVKVELEIKDLAALEIACKAIGLELVRGQTKFKWWEGQTDCLHAIRVKDATGTLRYEVGIVARKDGRPGFELQYDNFDHELAACLGPQANKLRQEYSAAVATKIYAKQGYRVARAVNKDGRIVLTATR